MADTLRIEPGSGLVVTCREFKVSEENLAASASNQRDGRAKTRLLEAVTVSVEDPGPYRFIDGRLDWDDVLRGEREIVLRALRTFTWDPDYFRDDPCPACKSPTENWFDLNSFPVQKLPDSSLDHVKGGKPLTAVLPRCGKKVEFRLLRGKDERDLAKIASSKEDELSSALHRLRVVSIEGVATGDLTKFIIDLGGKDSSYFRWAADEADCGIDQEAVWKCKACGNRWVKDVDFGQGYFFPPFREKTAST